MGQEGRALYFAFLASSAEVHYAVDSCCDFLLFTYLRPRMSAQLLEQEFSNACTINKWYSKEKASCNIGDLGISNPSWCLRAQ